MEPATPSSEGLGPANRRFYGAHGLVVRERRIARSPGAGGIPRVSRRRLDRVIRGCVLLGLQTHFTQGSSPPTSSTDSPAPRRSRPRNERPAQFASGGARSLADAMYCSALTPNWRAASLRSDNADLPSYAWHLNQVGPTVRSSRCQATAMGTRSYRRPQRQCRHRHRRPRRRLPPRDPSSTSTRPPSSLAF